MKKHITVKMRFYEKENNKINIDPCSEQFAGIVTIIFIAITLIGLACFAIDKCLI